MRSGWTVMRCLEAPEDQFGDHGQTRLLAMADDFGLT